MAKMKKNKKPGLFQRILKLIDHKIVVPTTKAIIRFSTRIKKIENNLENILTKQNALLFVSLFLALIVFISFDQKFITFNKQSSEVLKNKKIKALYNEEAYVIEGLPDTVDITLMGARSDLFIATQSVSSKVTVDLTKLKVGTHKVAIEYNQPFSSLTYSVNPSVANVNIYRKESESKTLSIDLLNQDNLDDTLIINEINPELNEVVVKGTNNKNARNSLSKVASVKALVDINKIAQQKEGVTTVKDVPIKAYDKNGEMLDVEIVPSKINVDLKITSPNKKVPIKVIPQGNIGFGKAINTITMSNETVTVYAKKSVLDNLEYIPLKVDITGLSENREYKLDLNKPTGVHSMSVNTVNLKFTLGEETNKDISNVNIDVRNLSDQYNVQGLSEKDIKVDVTAKGVESVLNNLDSDDITAYIDLKDYKPGEYEIKVQVEGTDSRVQFVSKTKKVKVKIVEK